MQKTRVQFLVRKDSTCHGATKSMCHNHWALKPELLKPACLDPVPATRMPCTTTTHCPCSLQLEKAHTKQRRPSTAKNKHKLFFKKKKGLLTYSAESDLSSLCFVYILPGRLVTKSCLTLATPWTLACQAPLSMGFARQEYWSGMPFPSPYLI